MNASANFEQGGLIPTRNKPLLPVPKPGENKRGKGAGKPRSSPKRKTKKSD